MSEREKDGIAVAVESFMDASEQEPARAFDLAEGSVDDDPEDERLRVLQAENRRLREANRAAIDRATAADLARTHAEQKAGAAGRAMVAAQERYEALSEVARAVHARIPGDALKDGIGDPVVAVGKTQPQLLRALAELAAPGKESK